MKAVLTALAAVIAVSFTAETTLAKTGPRIEIAKPKSTPKSTLDPCNTCLRCCAYL